MWIDWRNQKNHIRKLKNASIDKLRLLKKYAKIPQLDKLTVEKSYLQKYIEILMWL